jgi:oxygen-independent coproporphyrinogen-3 oxidase
LPFEFMLNALRLAQGVDAKLFPERTGMPASAVQTALKQAKSQGLITIESDWVIPTARGFDFLNDLQSLFLPTA